MVQNKGLIYKAHPTGMPKLGENLAVEDRPIDDLNSIKLKSNDVLIQNLYASLDPYQRGRMRPAERKSYNVPFTIGQPVDNFSVAKVLRSENSKFAPGDIIHAASVPTEEYTVISPEEMQLAPLKIDNPYKLDLKYFVGPLGMPGLTAYSSYYRYAEPKKGETIFISAASGAVGQIVGQLAKRDGLTVIGSVGDDQKLEYITKELNFDAGFNYKKEKPGDGLKRLAPDGIDIYYENVGGEHLEAAIDSMKDFGRIVACGMISQYNTPPAEQYGIKNLVQVVGKRLKLQGFIVLDLWKQYEQEHQKNMQQWIHDGSFKVRIHETKGIDNGPEGLVGIFKGENFGKAVLTISEP